MTPYFFSKSPPNAHATTIKSSVIVEVRAFKVKDIDMRDLFKLGMLAESPAQ